MRSQYNYQWEFAAVVLRDADSGSINCLCVGLKDEDSERASLVSMLKLSPDRAFDIHWLPSSLVWLTCSDISCQCGRISDQLWAVQERTGLHGSAYGKNLIFNEDNKIDVDQAIINLTAILDECARLRARTDNAMRLLVPLKRATIRGNGADGRSCEPWVKEILDRSEQTLLGSQEYLQWFQATTSSHLQTVRTCASCYGLFLA